MGDAIPTYLDRSPSTHTHTHHILHTYSTLPLERGKQALSSSSPDLNKIHLLPFHFPSLTSVSHLTLASHPFLTLESHIPTHNPGEMPFFPSLPPLTLCGRGKHSLSLPPQICSLIPHSPNTKSSENGESGEAFSPGFSPSGFGRSSPGGG